MTNTTEKMHDHALSVLGEHLQWQRQPHGGLALLKNLLTTDQDQAFDPLNASGTIVCSALLIDNHGDNLLMRHDSVADLWTPAGGPIHATDTSLLDCALRHAKSLGLRKLYSFGERPIGIDSRALESLAWPELEWELNTRLTHNFVFLIVVEEDFVPQPVTGQDRSLKWVPLFGIFDKIPDEWVSMLDILAPKIVPQVQELPSTDNERSSP